MSDFMDTSSISQGVVKKVQWLLLEYMLILCSMAFINGAQSPSYLSENLPLFHPSHMKNFSLRAASSPVLLTAPLPDYGSLRTSVHPPSSSQLSKPSMKGRQLPVPSAGLLPLRLEGVAPTQSNVGTIPSGLAQPPLSPHISDCCEPDMVLKQGSQACHCVYPIKLDLLLLNVSLSSNWSLFLEELASQLHLQTSQFEIINFYVLGLSRLNISMDITPHTGISFSASDVYAINSSLAVHRIHLDPTLVGDYKLLNLTWFKPPGPSHGNPDLSDINMVSLPKMQISLRYVTPYDIIHGY